MNQLLLTVPKAAKAYGVSTRLIRRAIQAGELHGFQFGDRWVRVDTRELDTWVRNNRVESASARGQRRAREV